MHVHNIITFLVILPDACVQWTYAIIYLARSGPKPLYLVKGPNYYVTKGKVADTQVVAKKISLQDCHEMRGI